MNIIIKFKNILIETLKENKKLIIGLYLLFIISFIVVWILSGFRIHEVLNNLNATANTTTSLGGVSATELFIHNELGGILTYITSIFFGIPSIILLIYNAFNLGSFGQLFNTILPNGGTLYILYLIPHGIFEVTATVLQSVAGILLFLFIWRFIKSMRNKKTNGISQSFEKTKKALIQSIVLMIFSTILLLIAAPIEAYVSIPFAEFVMNFF